MIRLYKIWDIPQDYTEEEVKVMKELIKSFRLRVGDDIPELNILYEKALRYSNRQIVRFMEEAVRDINSAAPITKYNLTQMYRTNSGLIILGAMIQMCIREGLLHAANQITFNDSGLAIDFYGKTGVYQSWAALLLQQYNQDKTEFKRGETARSPGAGFLGISSEFAYPRRY